MISPGGSQGDDLTESGLQLPAQDGVLSLQRLYLSGMVVLHAAQLVAQRVDDRIRPGGGSRLRMRGPVTVPTDLPGEVGLAVKVAA